MQRFFDRRDKSRKIRRVKGGKKTAAGSPVKSLRAAVWQLFLRKHAHRGRYAPLTESAACLAVSVRTGYFTLFS